MKKELINKKMSILEIIDKKPDAIEILLEFTPLLMRFFFVYSCFIVSGIFLLLPQYLYHALSTHTTHIPLHQFVCLLQ